MGRATALPHLRGARAPWRSPRLPGSIPLYTRGIDHARPPRESAGHTAHDVFHLREGAHRMSHRRSFIKALAFYAGALAAGAALSLAAPSVQAQTKTIKVG